MHFESSGSKPFIVEAGELIIYNFVVVCSSLDPSIAERCGPLLKELGLSKFPRYAHVT